MASYEGHEHLIVTLNEADKVLTICLNRPKTKNAWSNGTYLQVLQVLRDADEDERVNVLVLTGSNDFFSSGQDLKNIGDKKYAKLNMRHHPVGQFMWKMMHFSKPIVAAINGPAVGVGVTLIPHCDIAYATKSAYFMTPFARIGFVPEFVSSLTLREIVGPSLANEMLLGCKKVSAQEALSHGLVSALFDSPEEVRAAAHKIAKEMAAFPLGEKSLPLFKRMIKHPSRLKDLEDVFDMEMDHLTEVGKGGKSAKDATRFMQKKNESKL